ncbi:MAG: hypothetical protein V4719_19080 [Planctomycetota bacterium]
MPQVEPTTLNQIVRAGWKELANCDQSESDALAQIVRELLNQIERLEAKAA